MDAESHHTVHSERGDGMAPVYHLTSEQPIDFNSNQKRQSSHIGPKRSYVQYVESQTPLMMGLRLYQVYIRAFDTCDCVAFSE